MLESELETLEESLDEKDSETDDWLDRLELENDELDSDELD